MWATGLWCLRAAVELLIGDGRWLLREDFARVALGDAGRETTGETRVWVDFDAAIEALKAGALPCSSGERAILLIAASIAEGVPVNLRDALTGLDEPGVALVVAAVARAAGYDTTAFGVVRSR